MTEQEMTEQVGRQKSEAVETLRPRFDVGVASDVGKVRDHNEDCVLINEGAVIRSRGIDGIYVVADGMGGYGAGEVASVLAVEVIGQQVLERAFPRGVNQFSQLTSDEQKEWLSDVVKRANHAIFERRENTTVVAEKDMGTTLVVAIRSGDQVAVANVGDSRAYIISGDGKTIQQITQDHSLVASLEAAKQITAEEARVHPQRNVIYRAIGDKPLVEADVFFAKISRGGAMLLCSDGLSGMVENEQIRQIVVSSGTAPEATRRLIEAANAEGGEDNISAIVVKYGPEPKSAEEGKIRVQQTINDIAAEISGGSPDRRELTRLITELLSGAVALAADRKKLNKIMALALKVAQKYHLDFG